MKETEFINQNKDKWIKFERQLSSSADPEEIRELYTELNNDLSYAQTFYEKRKIRFYLNNLTQSIHRKFYKQKKEPLSTILKVWTIDLPLEVYRARKNLLFALVLFLIYATIGAFSTHQDINYAGTILGQGYVDQTEQNIAEGNPMGIYGNSSQSSMFIQITLNNILVALMCFFGGILFSLGTHVILFKNALMVGVFQYFFKLKGLLLTSFLTIWIHGAFEISAIIVASGAGFTLGHGILFPGSYTRLQSLQMSGLRGVRIMLSLVPIFIIAGFLESFVTRHYQTLPDWSKWLIVLFSFLVVLFYYVIYPILVARKYPDKVYDTPEVKVFEKIKFIPYQIRKNETIFRESFHVYFSGFYTFWKIISRTAIPLILLIVAFQFYMHYDALKTMYYIDWSEQLSILFGNPLGQNFNGISDIFISVFWLIPIVFIALATYYSIQTLKSNKNETKSFVTFSQSRFLKMILAILPLYFLIIVLPFFIVIPAVFLFPFFSLSVASTGLEKKPQLKSGFRLAPQKWASGFILFSTLCLLIFFLAQPFAFVFSFHDTYTNQPIMGDLLDWLSNFLLPIFAEITGEPMVFVNVLRQFIYLSFFILILPLFFIAFGLIFYTAKEENEAKGLRLDFLKFGKRNKNKESYADFE